MRVRLLIGEIIKPQYARYEVYNKLKKKRVYWGDTTIHKGGNMPKDYSPNGEPTYHIILSPGVSGVLCGFAWLDKHCADMVGYQPKVEMTMGGVRYKMVIKAPAIIKDIMKVNKIPKRERLAYSGV